MPRRRNPKRRRNELVDAALEDLPAVDVGEEALEVIDCSRLLARLQSGNGRKDAEELGAARRDLGGEGPGLSEVRAIAAVVALTDVVDRNAFGRVRIRSVNQPRIIE